MLRQVWALALLTGAACQGSTAPAGIVTTIHPLEMLVRELAGDRLPTASLVPPNATPHTFEPTPRDLARVSQARGFVRVGGSFDAWSARLLTAAERDPLTLTILEIPGLEPLTFAPSESSEHGSTTQDPHVWLDPIRVRDHVAVAVAGHLTALDPKGHEHYQARLEAFQARLSKLDREIRSLLETQPSRRCLAVHGSWRYFAERYGLEVIDVVQERPGAEPSPRRMANLVKRARRAGVPAILVEPQLSPRVAERIAAEFGGATVLVDALGDPAAPERARYPDLLWFDAQAFAQACTGSAS
jgi:zinc transport system substrate-binding protein